MIENLKVRRATVEDIDFLIEAIIEAEKSGSNIISSCNVFGLTEKKLRGIIKEILRDNIPNYDYYLSGFIVAEKEGEYIGALGSWLESAETPSSLIKTNMLFPYLDKNKMKEMGKYARLIKGFTINREPGALQLEYDYTREQFRRQGVFTRLIKESILRNKKEHSEIEKVQVVLLKANIKSLNAHIKFGFEVVDEKHVDDPEVFKFLPFDTKVLLELNKEKISSLSLD